MCRERGRDRDNVTANRRPTARRGVRRGREGGRIWGRPENMEGPGDDVLGTGGLRAPSVWLRAYPLGNLGEFGEETRGGARAAGRRRVRRAASGRLETAQGHGQRHELCRKGRECRRRRWLSRSWPRTSAKGGPPTGRSRQGGGKQSKNPRLSRAQDGHRRVRKILFKAAFPDPIRQRPDIPEEDVGRDQIRRFG